MGAARAGVLIIAVVSSAACPGGGATRPDAEPSADAAPTIDGDPGAADASAYGHTIVIDGTNDFAVSETFSTTTAGYAAYIAWDTAALYVGYQGSDVAITAPDSPTKWVLVYLDTDPGAGTGATTGEPYNTQQPGFPSGFGAEHYYRWKSDDSFADLRSWNGAGWDTAAAAPLAAVAGMFMEVAIPLAALGSPERLGVVTLMLNEQALGEWSYAGLYDGSFTDGYYAAPIPISAYLAADLGGDRAPTDPANRAP